VIGAVVDLNGCMAVRLLGRGDEGVVRPLLSRFKAYRTNEPAEFLADPRTLLFVADDDDALVGWLYAYELVRPEGRHAMLLYEVEVAAEARGRGHGRALVEALLAEARTRDHFRVWVLADPDNEAARALYTATGGKRSAQVMFTWGLA
jgi:ribosomal protein S18 acetylase RimI-like enzyme